MDDSPNNIVKLSSSARSVVEAFRAEHDRELLTILFTDLVGSTKQQSDLGNVEAARLSDLHRKIVRDLLAQYDAREIEWAGDSCLAVFTKPSEATLFALAMQAEHRRVRENEPNLPLVRVGIHIGEILVRHAETGTTQLEGLFGLQVSETARVMSLARGNQIYCTRAVFDSARGSLQGETIRGAGDLIWARHGLYLLKGSADPVEICEIGSSEGGAPAQAPEANEQCRPAEQPGRGIHSTWWIPAGIAVGIVIGVATVVLLTRGVDDAPIADRAFVQTEPEPVEYSTLSLPEDQPLAPPTISDTPLALSPDGSLLAYRTLYEGAPHLLLRRFGKLEGQVLPETRGVDRFVFSPDGNWIAFVRVNANKRTLMKISVDGSDLVPLAEVSIAFPLHWGDDGTIVYTPGYNSGILRISDTGGPAETLTELSEGELGHSYPYVLPGGKGILYTSFVQPQVESSRLMLLDVESGESQLLMEKAGGGHYLASGHIVFSQLGRFMAMPFDLERLEPSGPPYDVTAPAMVSLDSSPSRLSISASGTLAYVPNELDAADALSLVWVYRDGREEYLKLPPGSYESIDVFPDGKRAVVNVRGESGNSDLWTLDLERGMFTRFTFNTGYNAIPLVAPDSKSIFFTSNRSGGFGIHRKGLNDSEASPRLSPDGYDTLSADSVAADNSELLFTASKSGNANIMVLTLDGSGEARPLLNGRYNEFRPTFSPDGTWIAYGSAESGRAEIYVQSYPTLGHKAQISTNGGWRPQWSTDGDELFYREGGTKIIAVSIETDPEFRVGASEVIEGKYFAFDFHPDGDRFLATKAAGADNLRVGGTGITIVKNWIQLVKDRQSLEPQ